MNVYYFNRTDDLDQIGTINDAPSHSSYAEPQDPHYTGKKQVNTASLSATGFTDYVDIVEMAIQNFDQERIWCQDRLRGEQGFDAKHQICRCGPYSQDYNGKCLCSSFTELSANPSFCINSTRICTTPWNYGKKFVSAYDNLFMEIQADRVFFVENGTRRGHLEVHLSYTAQATAWTDIVVLGNNRTVIASLSKYLLGENLKTGEVWTQSLDKTGAECVQRSSFSLPWNEIAPLAQVEPLSGNFLFKVYAHTNLLRQENRVILRDLEAHGESAELITAVPILISLNTSVTTTSQRSPSFNLDFSINGTYYVKESQVNPTGTQLRVVISHTVSNPLSFVVGVTSVTFDGNATTAEIEGSVPVNCGPNFNLDNQAQVCEQETTLVIDLPTGFDCTDRVVNLNIVFNASCEGPNKLENSTVCASVYDQVNASQATSVPASISFNVNFCPHIEDTTITTKSFSIRQKHRNIPSGGEIKSNHVLNGTITLDVLQTVVDTRFESATIQSVFLYEQVPSNETINFLDVTLDCLTERGFEIRQDEIQISFSYIPNIYMLTKLLKNWYTGLYFVVVIDVHYLPKDLVSGKNSPLKSQVRLQIPTNQEEGVATTERAKSTSSFFTIKRVSSAKRSDVKTDAKDFTLEKAKTVSEQYNKETKKNEVLFIVLGSCIAVTMFIIVITLIIVAYNKFKTQPAPSPVQN